MQALRGDPEKWDRWSEIRRCNPLMAGVCVVASDTPRRTRRGAQGYARLKARFLSYRLNCPTADEVKVLLTVDEWKNVLSRAVPERRGRPVVGVDCGGGARMECGRCVLAEWSRRGAGDSAPGTPSIADQEKRDLIARGTYQSLAASGVLTVDGDRRVPRVSALIDRVLAWQPSVIACDRFRLSELQDAVRGAELPVVPRIQRWSESSEDVRACRRVALDGPLAVAAESRGLLSASLAVAKVESDTSGNVRLTKRGTNNQARDDVAAALVLAVGAASKSRAQRGGIVRSTLCEASA